LVHEGRGLEDRVRDGGLDEVFFEVAFALVVHEFASARISYRGIGKMLDLGRKRLAIGAGDEYDVVLLIGGHVRE